ncbi:MAG: XdhC family protein [Acetobacteraceae bacterium]|nr:XdhC family protein [Acetobacteraceae bacterium]
MKSAALSALQAARAAKRPVVFATRLSDGHQILLPDAAASDALNAAAHRALSRDENATKEIEGEAWFLHAYSPPVRLVIVGAVHIAQSLVPMSAPLGLDLIVVDPRRSFATEDRFPNVTLMDDWPDEAMDKIAPDSRTAVITLTHDPKLDDPALDRALRSDAFYIGSLGSRKTHAARLARLAALGHDEAALARIKGPVGLDIGAVSAPEIALSILAEFVAYRRRIGQTP